MKKPVALASLLTCLTALSLPAWAGGIPRGVIELFTSQGCSSCPPADALLREFAQDKSIIAVSLPVTYWDYLGWKDTLAEKAFSKRQRAYAETRGDGQIYTPQVVINGARHALGSDRKSIEAAINDKLDGGKGQIGTSQFGTSQVSASQVGTSPADRSAADRPAAGKPLSVPLEVSDASGSVKVTIPQGRSGQTAAIWLMAISKSHNVAIGRGENTGRSIVYTNVVRRITKLGDWSGEAMTVNVSRETARPPGTDGYVVLLQTVDNGRPGVILGAAKSDGF